VTNRVGLVRTAAGDVTPATMMNCEMDKWFWLEKAEIKK
jgi:hypothetical protein